jgi:hypothetical protein
MPAGPQLAPYARKTSGAEEPGILERTLKSFSSYDHCWRTHLSLGKGAPKGRQIQTPDEGKVIEIQEVGSLPHHYERRSCLTYITTSRAVIRPQLMRLADASDPHVRAAQ